MMKSSEVNYFALDPRASAGVVIYDYLNNRSESAVNRGSCAMKIYPGEQDYLEAFRLG
jgi:hypothetical protein